MNITDALSRSCCRERRLNNQNCFKGNKYKKRSSYCWDSSCNDTSSSAVAKKPRDASTVQNVEQSFIVSYLGYRFVTACAQLNALFCCLWRNVEASCHKHFVVFSGNQHRRLLPAKCHNLRDGGRPPATAFTTPACCSVNTGSQARYTLRIAISAYHTCNLRPS